MNKKDIMRQPSLRALLESLIRETPGVETAKLWNAAKQWDSNLGAGEFDSTMAAMRAEFRVTNKKWYAAGKAVA